MLTAYGMWGGGRPTVSFLFTTKKEFENHMKKQQEFIDSCKKYNKPIWKQSKIWFNNSDWVHKITTKYSLNIAPKRLLKGQERNRKE